MQTAWPASTRPPCVINTPRPALFKRTRPRTGHKMPAHAALGDDCARFELRENLVTHLKALPCPEVPCEPWPGLSSASSSRPLPPPHVAPIALGDPVALDEAARGLAAAWRALGQACAEGRPLATPDPWLAPLCQPAALDGPEAVRVVDTLLLASKGTPDGAPRPPSQQELAFTLLRTLPFFDRWLAAACFPGHSRLYELELARHVMRRLGSRASLDQCALELSGWRRRGLYYPLLLAAASLPTLQQWLPPELEHEPPARGLAALLAALASPALEGPDLDSHVADFARSQAGPAHHASARHIASSLDRVAAVMRVKSDAAHRNDHALSGCLDRLRQLTGNLTDPVDIWARAKTELERALPPSALQAPAKGKAAW